MTFPDLSGASCAGFNTELFFPVSAQEEREIRPFVEMMCNDCIVYTKCFDYAIHNQVEGFWAGTNDTERRAIRKQRGIEAKPLSNDVRNVLQSETPKAIKMRERREQAV